MTCSCGQPVYCKGRCRKCYWKYYSHNRVQIERRLRKFKGKLTERECLNCGVTFKSEGPHNRRCSHCRALDSKLPPIVVYEVRP